MSDDMYASPAHAELARLRKRIADAKDYGSLADWRKLRELERRRDALERILFPEAAPPVA